MQALLDLCFYCRNIIQMQCLIFSAFVVHLHISTVVFVYIIYVSWTLFLIISINIVFELLCS